MCVRSAVNSLWAREALLCNGIVGDTGQEIDATSG